MALNAYFDWVLRDGIFGNPEDQHINDHYRYINLYIILSCSCRCGTVRFRTQRDYYQTNLDLDYQILKTS